MEDNQKQRAGYWLPLFVVVLGAFAAILNNSSVNVAIPKMMAIFGVSAGDIQWVLTAYMLTSGVVIPIMGYLGDAYGAKRIYLYCLMVFTAGSVLCGLSWNNNSMIAARVIQGIGGGAIMPISMAIIYRIVPREKIGMALGVWGMAAVTGPAIGPTLGGYIVEHLNWRFLFLMNVPVGLLGIALGGMLLPESPIKKGLKLDFWGFLTSSTGCFALLLALSQGQKEGWHSYYIVSLFILAFYLLLMFVIIELTTPQPMLDLRLFKNKIFSISVIGGCVVYIGLFGGVLLIPLFTQNLMGKSAMDTGIMLMPAALVTAVMMPVSGALFDRMGARTVTLVGLTILALGTFEFKNLSINSTTTYVMLIASLRSLGMGLSMMPMTTAGMNTVPVQEVGRASALNNVCRQVAASFGVAGLTTIMQDRQAFHYAHLAESISITSPVAPNIIKQLDALPGPAYTGQGTGLALASSLAAKEAAILAIDDTFIVAAAICAIAIPTALFLGRVRKKPYVPADAVNKAK
ncbi:membrane component of multidrug resistance system [Desulfocucumis palustris]|uniref:Membrane component of multidrug resistance system n=1 Tax=Desulfocucumis palustris TaxID=1898651 RepID=A0A2L2X9N0_9FIRM|nr:DHA2 family efflux MFS transporter permease subunit [Desulfocucumis palustris]GBF32905.1 membrane component of multidrug resistance system [Desulfocucumis palustris]